MKNHGTASATQVGEILREAIKAITTVIDDFSAKDILNALNGNGLRFAGMIRSVFTALLTNQEIVVQPPTFPTWKTIKLGTHKTVEDLKTAVKAAGHNISDWANDILGKSAFALTEEESELELVRVSVAELGFKNGATRKDIYARAIELGLALCPNEVGPQLRLQYGDQPKGEWILIAMEPIADSDGGLSVFFVERYDGGKSWLRTGCGRPGRVWDGSCVWVFARRK